MSNKFETENKVNITPNVRENNGDFSYALEESHDLCNVVNKNSNISTHNNTKNVESHNLFDVINNSTLTYSGTSRDVFLVVVSRLITIM